MRFESTPAFWFRGMMQLLTACNCKVDTCVQDAQPCHNKEEGLAPQRRLGLDRDHLLLGTRGGKSALMSPTDSHNLLLNNHV